MYIIILKAMLLRNKPLRNETKKKKSVSIRGNISIRKSI